MAGEYVVLRAVHPTYLNLQMPREVGELLLYEAREDGPGRGPNRGLAFLARGPGVLRVVPSLRAGDFLPVESARGRYLANAALTEKLIFNLPEAVVQHLGLHVQRRSPKEAPFTDDGLVWFLPAPEYYEFRARQRQPKGWAGPTGGGIAHVYLARSVLPWGGPLEEIERRIDLEEWRPRQEALSRVGRPRRAGPV